MTVRRTWLLSGLALVAGMALAAFLAPWPQGETPADGELVALGQKVYGEHCASCHGATLEGETPEWRTRKENGSLPAPPHDESGHTWHHPDPQLFGIIKRGIAPFAPAGYVSDMPAFGDVLSDREIWAVLAYIKSTWPPETQRMQQERTAQATRAAQGG